MKRAFYSKLLKASLSYTGAFGKLSRYHKSDNESQLLYFFFLALQLFFFLFYEKEREKEFYSNLLFLSRFPI